MDAIDKRVVRRYAALIAWQLRVTVETGRAALRQGLLRAEQLVDVLEPVSNQERVKRFLASIEEVNLAPIPKLAFFLRGQGHSTLADAITIDQLLERGQLQIEPELAQDVMRVVNQRVRGFDDEKSAKKLAVLVAAKYQLQRELGEFDARNPSVESDFMEHILALGKSMTPFTRGTILNKMDSTDKESHYNSTEKKTIEFVPCSAGVKSDWKIESDIEANNYMLRSTVSDQQCKSASPRCQANATNGDKMSNTTLNASERNEALLQRRRTWPESTTKTTHILEAHKKHDSALNRMDIKTPTSANDSSEVSLTASRFCNELIISKGEKDTSFRPIATRKQTNVHFQSENNRNGREKCTKPKQTSYTINAKTHKHIRSKPKAKKAAQKKVHFSTRDIQDDLNKLDQANRHIRNVNRAVSYRNTPPTEKAVRDLEVSYWKSRCEFMKNCKSTGYYYFLSERKRERCDACSLAKTSSHQPECLAHRPHGRTASLASFNKSELNLYKASSFVKMVDRSPKASRLAKVTLEDTLCPGAGFVPGQEEPRCLPCAFASKTQSSIYDSIVDYKGENHHVVPLLDKNGTTDCPRDKRRFQKTLVEVA